MLLLFLRMETDGLMNFASSKEKRERETPLAEDLSSDRMYGYRTGVTHDELNSKNPIAYLYYGGGGEDYGWFNMRQQGVLRLTNGSILMECNSLIHLLRPSSR